jgi:hypothetical protein
MPVPSLEEWRKRWETEGARRLGVRPIEAKAEGWAQFIIDTPFGDERDADENFFYLSLSYAVDVVALAAVLARVDPDREQPNGTAALHLNLVAAPRGAVTVDGRVVHWEIPNALLEIEATDSEGRLIARGLSPYSLRAKASDEAPA